LLWLWSNRPRPFLESFYIAQMPLQVQERRRREIPTSDCSPRCSEFDRKMDE